MKTVSVNGLLKPIAKAGAPKITNEYLGHFLKVSYVHELAATSVFRKDRIDVSESGLFRFFIPGKDELSDQSVSIAVFAPDGEQLGEQTYTYGSLKAEEIPSNLPDNSAGLEINIDPKKIEIKTTKIIERYYKVSGRLVDVSGMNKSAGAQIVIMASNDPMAEPGASSFQPVFSSQTNAGGYFYGRVENKDIESAYGLVAGIKDNPIAIQLQSKKIPENLIMATDLSDLSDDANVAGKTPNLPDGADLARDPFFSQDIGGKCVDFTVPNRTLEEFSFYHTVRTTEPEIKGLTLTAGETKIIRSELIGISEEMFTLFGRMRDSLGSLNVINYTIEGEKSDATKKLSKALTSEVETDEIVTTPYSTPVFYLNVTSGTAQLKMSTRDLMLEKKGIQFGEVVTILAEQERRKARLQELHRKLAAAYCGKRGLQEPSTYCESLLSKDLVNRDTLKLISGQIKNYAVTVGSRFKLLKQLTSYLDNLEVFIDQPILDSGNIKSMKTRTEKLIKDLDSSPEMPVDKEDLMGLLHRLVTEFEQAAGKVYTFEPCPSPKTADTMGILCLIQEFNATREILRNKEVLTLSEILRIRANYDTYVTSIASFLGLLEQFYSFYMSGSNLLISLEDEYFVKNYSQIKNSLKSLKQQIYAAINKIEALIRQYISNHPGRKELTVENSVDWDDTPTIYENTTIAHGHILHFKQMWKADGYSLGDLLYSLPLAPCQEKQIAIIDWDREERAARTEEQKIAESLVAEISRDRDISEIMNSSFRENISASSFNKTSGTSAGLGGGIFGAIGGLFGGVSHSGASSRSTATQDSARDLSASTLNHLQDNIAQSASSLRTQRSTVIQTVGQNETMTVQTEVVRNNNHCHAITIEYFEVLKHYVIEQKLVDVQECLFVPLPMGLFDHKKILRWKNTLRRGIYGPQLVKGFDAIERIDSNYANSDFPVGSYADETIEDFRGYFTVSFQLKRPYISAIDEATKTETYNLSEWFPWFPGVMKISLEREVPLTEGEKDALFEKEYAPEIVKSFIDTLEIYGISESGIEIKLDLDLTLLSNYRSGVPLQISIASRSVQNITRRQIKHLRFRANTVVRADSKIILRSVFLYYSTRHLNEAIIRNGSVNNDIINSIEVHVDFPGIHIDYKTDAALIYTPLSSKELRDPRKEDREAAAALVSFLNENIEMAHKLIWASMDASRLFGLLDGYIAPNSGGKSVASIVENKVLGIVGNNLVLKVIPGERLDPVFRYVTDLLTYYQPTMPPDPFRISVPTKGVYAEAVMGKCNCCEEIDETRHWRFNEVPCGSQPTPIEPVSTESRRSDVGNLQVKDLPSSIINLQNAPAAPDPTGLTAAFNLLGKSDVFKDMTGLAGTQANAIKALETTSKSVTELAGMAADLKKQEAMKKDIGKTMKTIQEAEDSKQISKDQANKLAMSALGSMVGIPTKKQADDATPADVQGLAESASSNKASIKFSRPTGEQIEVDARPNPVPVPASSSTLSGLEDLFGLSETPVASAVSVPNPVTDKPKALVKIQAFRSEKKDSAWHSSLARDKVADGLTTLVNLPDGIDQGVFGFCGPAAFFNVWFNRDPLAATNFAVKLFNNGSASIGSREIEPGHFLHGDDIRQSDYSAIEKAVNAKGNLMLPPAEWMIMGSYQDTNNSWFKGDFEGSPDETDELGVSASDTAAWLNATGLFSNVRDESSTAPLKVEHLTGLVPNVNREILLLITAHLVNAGNKKTPVANHYVILRSAVTEATPGKYTFKVWTWGSERTVTVTKADIESQYFGAIICER